MRAPSHVARQPRRQRDRESTPIRRARPLAAGLAHGRLQRLLSMPRSPSRSRPTSTLVRSSSRASSHTGQAILRALPLVDPPSAAPIQQERAAPSAAARGVFGVSTTCASRLDGVADSLEEGVATARPAVIASNTSGCIASPPAAARCAGAMAPVRGGQRARLRLVGDYGPILEELALAAAGAGAPRSSAGIALSARDTLGTSCCRSRVATLVIAGSVDDSACRPCRLSAKMWVYSRYGSPPAEPLSLSDRRSRPLCMRVGASTVARVASRRRARERAGSPGTP